MNWKRGTGPKAAPVLTRHEEAAKCVRTNAGCRSSKHSESPSRRSCMSGNRLGAARRKALVDVAAPRAEVRGMADPPAQALHLDSNTVRTAQAAAMVGMCLAAGYIIAFGAGLIWPRS